MSTFNNYLKDDFQFIRTKYGFSTPTFGKIDKSLDTLFEETEKILSNPKSKLNPSAELVLKYFMGCKGDNKKEFELYSNHIAKFDPKATLEPIYSIVMKSRE